MFDNRAARRFKKIEPPPPQSKSSPGAQRQLGDGFTEKEAKPNGSNMLTRTGRVVAGSAPPLGMLEISQMSPTEEKRKRGATKAGAGDNSFLSPKPKKPRRPLAPKDANEFMSADEVRGQKSTVKPATQHAVAPETHQPPSVYSTAPPHPPVQPSIPDHVVSYHEAGHPATLPPNFQPVAVRSVASQPQTGQAREPHSSDDASAKNQLNTQEFVTETSDQPPLPPHAEIRVPPRKEDEEGQVDLVIIPMTSPHEPNVADDQNPDGLLKSDITHITETPPKSQAGHPPQETRSLSVSQETSTPLKSRKARAKSTTGKTGLDQPVAHRCGPKLTRRRALTQ